MKYNRAHEMFNDMMNFAISNGMTAYQSDLMHDAALLERTENSKMAITFLWVVKSNGCGTWMWDMAVSEVPSIILNDTGAKVIIKYDGNSWTFDKQ